MEQQNGREGGQRGFLVIVEQGKRNYSAYSPDVPGCIATGRTLDEVRQNMREALAFHLEGLKLENLTLPVPHTFAEYLEVPIAS